MKIKKIFILLLTLILCITMFPVASMAAEKPAPPKGLKSVAVSKTSLKLSWTKVSGAKNYTVYQKVGGKYVKKASTAKNTYTVKKLKAGSKYSFKLAITTKNGTSSQSKAVKGYTKCVAPTGIKASALSKTSAKVTWKASKGAQKYRVYVSTTSSKAYWLAGVTKSKSFTVKGLGSGTKYYFKVAAINGNAVSAYSKHASAKTQGTPGEIAPTYVLTVKGGTGSGNYNAGAVITIKANTAAAGKVFDKWTSTGGGKFADATSATTTFTMPANPVTVIAAYKDTLNQGASPISIKIGLKSGNPYMPLTGGICTLATAITPVNASKDTTVTWSSDKTNVATVDQSGLVTAVSTGSAVITARTANGKTDTIAIKVASNVSTVTSYGTHKRIMLQGTTIPAPMLELKEPDWFTPADAYDVYTYTSNDSSIAEVRQDSTGQISIYGKQKGRAKIRVTTHNGRWKDIDVYVLEPITSAKFLPATVSKYQNMEAGWVSGSLSASHHTFSVLTPPVSSDPGPYIYSMEVRSTNPEVLYVGNFPDESLDNFYLEARSAGTATLMLLNNGVEMDRMTVTVKEPVVAKPGLTFVSSEPHGSVASSTNLKLQITRVDGAANYRITSHNSYGDAQSGTNPVSFNFGGSSYTVSHNAAANPIVVSQVPSRLHHFRIVALNAGGTQIGDAYAVSMPVLCHARNIGGFNQAGDGYLRATANSGWVYDVTSGMMVAVTTGMGDPFQLYFTWEKVPGASGYDTYCYRNGEPYGDDLGIAQPAGNRVSSMSGSMNSGTIRIIIKPYVMNGSTKLYGPSRTAIFYVDTRKFSTSSLVRYWDTTSTVNNPTVEFFK